MQREGAGGEGGRGVEVWEGTALIGAAASPGSDAPAGRGAAVTAVAAPEVRIIETSSEGTLDGSTTQSVLVREPHAVIIS